MVSFREVDKEDLIDILKEYIEPRYWDSNDFDEIIKNAVVNEEWSDVRFDFNQVNIYLDYNTLEYKDAEPKEGI